MLDHIRLDKVGKRCLMCHTRFRILKSATERLIGCSRKVSPFPFVNVFSIRSVYYLFVHITELLPNIGCQMSCPSQLSNVYLCSQSKITIFDVSIYSFIYRFIISVKANEFHKSYLATPLQHARLRFVARTRTTVQKKKKNAQIVSDSSE